MQRNKKIYYDNLFRYLPGEVGHNLLCLIRIRWWYLFLFFWFVFITLEGCHKIGFWCVLHGRKVSRRNICNKQQQQLDININNKMYYFVFHRIKTLLVPFFQTKIPHNEGIPFSYLMLMLLLTNPSKYLSNLFSSNACRYIYGKNILRKFFCFSEYKIYSSRTFDLSLLENLSF